MLRWIENNCNQIKYIFKTDDDILVNTKLLLDKLPEIKSGITGYCLSGDTFYRSGKQAMLEKYYTGKTLPTYCYGCFYIIDKNSVHLLLKIIDSYSGYYLDIDDVFITGIIAEKAGVNRQRHRRIDWYKQCSDKNNVKLFSSLYVIFECMTAEESKEFWDEWKNCSKNIECINHSENIKMFYSNYLFIIPILFIILFY